MVQFIKIVVGIMNGRAPIESKKVRVLFEIVLFLEFWLIKTRTGYTRDYTNQSINHLSFSSKMSFKTS